MKKTVYNIKTGKPAEVEGVDATEYVATGGWSYDPPAETPKKQSDKKAGA
jgi:hypothetical protein